MILACQHGQIQHAITVDISLIHSVDRVGIT